MTPERLLPSELTIYTVGELRPQWLAWLAEPSSTQVTDEAFTVDAAAVAEVDAAGVQLLVALQRALSDRQLELRLVAPSRALATACTALGLDWLVGTVEPGGVPA